MLLNEGNGFLQHSGVFVAPVDGLYVFSISLMSRGKEVQASIIKNGQSYARTFSNESFSQGSVSATMKLQAGDEVYVRCDHPSDTVINGNGFSSFTGFLSVAF